MTEKLEAAEHDILKVTEVSKVKIAALEENLIALDHLDNELTSNSVVLEEKLKEMAEKLEDTERRYSLERDQLLEERSVIVYSIWLSYPKQTWISIGRRKFRFVNLDGMIDEVP